VEVPVEGLSLLSLVVMHFLKVGTVLIVDLR